LAQRPLFWGPKGGRCTQVCCIFIIFVRTSIATLISGDCRPSAFLKADDEVVNVSFADEDQEDVDALKHVDDVSHIPEVDLCQVWLV
jgi:hypothetical protein